MPAIIDFRIDDGSLNKKWGFLVQGWALLESGRLFHEPILITR